LDLLSLDLERLKVTQNTAEKLLQHFGTEEAVQKVLDGQDVTSITSIQGISEKKACEMVLNWHATEVRDLLRTEPAKKTFQGIIERILQFANTPQTRNRVLLLRPLANPGNIKDMAKFVDMAKKEVQGLDQEAVAKNLRRLKPFTKAKPRFDGDVLMIAENEQIYSQWEAQGVPKWVYLSTPDDSPNPVEYSLVVYLYDTGEISFDGLDNIVMVQADSKLSEVVPDAVIQDFEKNYSVLDASKNLSSLLGRDTSTEEALAILDAQKVTRLDPEEFESWVMERKEILNQEISATIKAHSFTGDQVVNLLSKDLPEPIQRIYTEAFTRAREEARERFGVHILPFKEEFPVDVDEEAVESVKRRIGAQGRLKEWEQKVRAATKLEKLRTALEEEIDSLIDYDYRFCLGRFADTYDLKPPSYNDGALHFQNGLSLDFWDFKDKQLIDYSFGEGPDDKVVILTGANSGGKTSLLETITQMTIMASMGMPVRAEEANIVLFDELYCYHQKRSLDAGGFEAFLKGFIPLCLNPGKRRRLILADELESITELEAASKIISAFIQELKTSGSYAVIVTHMANEISEQVKVRIDGIEATGLDENLELIVDRTPKKDYFARSTPELILRKLQAEAKGELKTIYDRVLERF
jgi:dsDNA-specific endonuclease/ATPase MutS2